MNIHESRSRSDGRCTNWFNELMGPLLRLRTNVSDNEIETAARPLAHAFADALYSGDEKEATDRAQVQADNVRATYAPHFAHAIWERANSLLIEMQDERNRWLGRELRQAIISAALSADPDAYWRIKQHELQAKGLSLDEVQDLKKRADEAVSNTTDQSRASVV